MQVRNFKAESNPRGGRIDLSWFNPDATEFPALKGIRILRREFTEPAIRIEGATIKIESPSVEIYDDSQAKPGNAGRLSDIGLKGDTVYYYAAFAYGPGTQISPLAIAAALATTPYQTADELYRNLPALYQRLDTIVPPDAPELDPADKDKGQLRRLIEMFGLQMDLLRSYAGGTRDFSEVDRIDGALLRLLADWIGWQTDSTLPLAKQRYEIKYAPHYYRTTGIAANLRATINRLTTWDAQIKEFAHNIFVTNAPEQLFIQETERREANWPAKPLVKLVTLDVAYEGRASIARETDDRSLLVYHTRQSSSKTDAVAEQWHICYKLFDQAGWLPARRLSFDGDINKYPSAVQTRDGNVWVFWSSFEAKGAQRVPRIKLQIISAGRPARPPQLRGAVSGPFSFSDGDEFKITIQDGVIEINRTVVFHSEHFQDLTKATSVETAALLDRELPGVDVTVEVGAIVITSSASGAKATLTLPTSAVATKLGLTGAATGSDPSRAQLTGRGGPFELSKGDQMVIRVDDNPAKIVTFAQAKLSAAEAAAAINSVLPGVASDKAGSLRLSSPNTGRSSFIAIDVDGSTAAPKIGFGAPLPQGSSPADDSQPAGFEDNSGNIWLFWSSRRADNPSESPAWRIWYNRFDTATARWGEAKRLTTGIDCEPAIAFDRANGAAGQGKIWVCWSRQKSDGRWNIFYRTATKIDFGALTNADWREFELSPIPSDYDRKEPAPVLIASENVELYFSANRNDGWQVWLNPLTPSPAAADQRITSNQFTCRAPVALKTNQGVRLLFRSNESQVYNSPSYPASQTIDARYAGSTTVDVRNAAKIGVRGNAQDVLRYTYDTGRADDDWYARDTVGIYLTPDTDDEKLILRKQSTIAGVVKSFLPIQVRPVFIIQQVYPELVYTYSQADAKEPRFIGEETVDTILSEVYSGFSDTFRDRVNFRFIRTWRDGPPTKGVADLNVTPPDLSFRLFMRGVDEGA